MTAEAREGRMSRVLADVRTVARVLTVSLVVVGVLTLVPVLVAGWPLRSTAGFALLTVAGLAPFVVSTGANQLMDLGIDALTGRPRGSQTDAEPPSPLAPGGMFLFVSIPLGVLGLFLAG